MTVIALILLALVIFAVVAAVTADAGTVSIEVFDRNIDTTVTEVFLAGVLTGLVALAAIVLLRIAARRSWLRRKEVRELRQQAQRTPAQDTAPESRIVDPDEEDAYIRRDRSEPETAVTDRAEPSPEPRRE
jgi:type VI protein secretion system component VasK